MNDADSLLRSPVMEIIKLSKIKIMDSFIIKFLNQTLDHGLRYCPDNKKL